MGAPADGATGPMMTNEPGSKNLACAWPQRAVVVAVVVAAVGLSTFRISNYDLWHHMKMGQYVLEHRGVPSEDLFSFTSSRPWVNPAWLSGVVFYGLFALAGPGAVILLKAALVAAAIGLAARSARRAGAGPIAVGVAAVLALYTMRVRLVCRPHVFSICFLAAAAYVLREFTAGRARRLWVLPALCLLWANLHAGFFALFALFPLYMIDVLRSEQAPSAKAKQIRTLVACAVLCAAAALVNPFGVRTLIHPFTLTSSAQLAMTAEWQPMRFATHWFRPGAPGFMHSFAFFWLMFALLAGAIAATARRVTPSDALTVLVFGVMAITGRRHVDLFAVAALPVLAKHLSLAFSREGRALGRRPRLAVATQGGLALAVACAGLWLRFGAEGRRLGLGVDESLYPVEAAQFVEDKRVPGRMLNYWSWGSYLIWRLWPEKQVFADGRFEVYDPSVFKDWLTVNDGRPGWRERLDRRQINFTVVGANPSQAGTFESGGWALVYWDDLCVVYVRRSPENQPLIDRFECGATHPLFFLDRLESGKGLAEIEAQLRGKIEQDPACSKAHGNLGKLLIKTARWPEAVAEFETVTKLRPWSPSAWHDLGRCYMRLGRFEDAIRAFRTVVYMPGFRRSRGLAHLRLGGCWQQLGHRPRAAKHYRKATRLLPDNAQARAGLAATQ